VGCGPCAMRDARCAMRDAGEWCGGTRVRVQLPPEALGGRMMSSALDR
jgi:hypothetical protein